MHPELGTKLSGVGDRKRAAVHFLGLQPLGSRALGHIGDRQGRAKALTISIVGMSIATVGMGLVPGYDTIGIAAPILMVAVGVGPGTEVIVPAVGFFATAAAVVMAKGVPMATSSSVDSWRTCCW